MLVQKLVWLGFGAGHRPSFLVQKKVQPGNGPSLIIMPKPMKQWFDDETW